jgi:phage shock protein PspC (stress-responsive transcriptional regulator)
MEKLLKRTQEGKWIAGVCGGLGKFFGMDPTIWRLIFLIGGLFSGIFPFLFVYVIMWFTVPLENFEK